MSETLETPKDDDSTVIAELRTTLRNKNTEISAKDAEIGTHKATIAQSKAELAERDAKIEQLTPLQSQLETMKSEFEAEKAELTTKAAKAELAEKYEADMTAMFDKQIAAIPEAKRADILALVGDVPINEKFAKLEAALKIAGTSGVIKLGTLGGEGGSGTGTGEAGAFNKNVSWGQALTPIQ
jgi:chromosome segregation ATPase